MNSHNHDPIIEKRDVCFLSTIDAFHLELANQIRDARETARYSRNELALLVGVADKTIQRMETHHMYTDPVTGVTTHTYSWVGAKPLIEVCRILNISTEAIWSSVAQANSDS